MPIENVNTVNATQVQKPDSANQTAKIQTATKPYPNDTVEINGKKKTGMSNGTKVGIGGIIAIGIGVLVYALTKGKSGPKQVKQLAEHIEFNEAKSMEEAVKYAKEQLGINKFDVGDNLEMANWINNGLTRVSNRYKGKAPIPTIVERYPEELYKESIKKGEKAAMAVIDIEKGRMRINTHYIEDAKNNIKKRMDDMNFKIEKSPTNGKIKFQFKKTPFMNIEKQNCLIPLLTKVTNGTATSTEIIACEIAIEDMLHFNIMLLEKPEFIYSHILKSGKLQNIFSQKGLEILPSDMFKTKTKNEQIEYLYDLFNNVTKGAEDNELISMFSEIRIADRQPDVFHIIDHEMGHALQAQSIGLKNFYKTNLLSDAEKDVATTISNYATTNSREFVAEVHAELMEKHPVTEEVMALYKKYNGTIPPA